MSQNVILFQILVQRYVYLLCLDWARKYSKYLWVDMSTSRQNSGVTAGGLKNSAGTHCNTLQHTVTHFNTLQHTETHYNTL